MGVAVGVSVGSGVGVRLGVLVGTGVGVPVERKSLMRHKVYVRFGAIVDGFVNDLRDEGLGEGLDADKRGGTRGG